MIINLKKNPELVREILKQTFCYGGEEPELYLEEIEVEPTDVDFSDADLEDIIDTYFNDIIDIFKKNKKLLNKLMKEIFYESKQQHQ